MNDNQDTAQPTPPHLPDAETILEELAKAKSIDDLTGKDGVFARLFGKTLTVMLEGEMSAHLGYEPYEAKGRNSGNSRNMSNYGRVWFSRRFDIAGEFGLKQQPDRASQRLMSRTSDDERAAVKVDEIALRLFRNSWIANFVSKFRAALLRFIREIFSGNL
jgi:hypothetical protein